MPPTIVAIDGPAASGKSSTARAVARALGYAHLDSGAVYRALTLVALDLGLERGGGADAILAAAEERGLGLRPGEEGFDVWLDGREAESRIRSADVTASVSGISADPAVRAWVNRLIQDSVRGAGGVVLDGRDIGTTVFPDAEFKFYLNASPLARAERRLRQRGEALDPADVARERDRLAARDAADASRAVAPLRPAADAHLIDGTDLSFEEQVRGIVRVIQGG